MANVVEKITLVQILPEWRKKIAMDQEMNAKSLGISVEEYRDIERHYLLKNIMEGVGDRVNG